MENLAVNDDELHSQNVGFHQGVEKNNFLKKDLPNFIVAKLK